MAAEKAAVLKVGTWPRREKAVASAEITRRLTMAMVNYGRVKAGGKGGLDYAKAGEKCGGGLDYALNGGTVNVTIILA